ncbi:CotH kinase family protein [Flavobacterium granuli]|uniref:Spore coat protein CotH n=1 Tax=Flavobacterium granuli TaxID=280093 RepID=A0ABU1S6T4_9FLAO|nr:CotH kinase family protein [Flavobacterium granuli]MDR6845945.1 spore coat protein CotH [Flavobacterium granuli]
MKKIYSVKFFVVFKIILAFVLFSPLKGFSQVVFTDSNLPIIIINTDIDPSTTLPFKIVDDPKVLATMKIIKRPDGSRNYLTDENTVEFLNYNGRIGIELRGSSSQELPKKPYGLTTVKANGTSNNNVSILGMPTENDWILNSLAFDPSLIRDYLSYDMSRKLGNYASRTQYCEVVLNGDYIGLYVFQEKIKSNENRVNVTKIEKTDTSLPNLSGGYITKADRPDPGTTATWVMEETNFIHELPKPENATAEQTAYIKGEFDRFNDNLYNSDLESGYQTVIDVPSFVDFMLVNELASNADVYQYSTYFHKDKGGKLRAGPVWDFNLAYGSTFTSGSDVDKWQFDNGSKTGPWFWAGLFDNGDFICYFSRRWNEVTATGKPLNYDILNSFIDSTLAYISEAIPREQQRWGTLGDHTADVSRIKTFLAARINWITAHAGSYSECSNIDTPPLVITKLNYNPATSAQFPSNDIEFMAIQNTGLESVNLSGVYLSQLGLCYQFPFNSTIAAKETIYLTSNLTAFKAKYGFAAFGQYSRNLSNTSQKIVLADSYGTVIDAVEYSGTAPWPTAANGTGSYLELTDISSDNNIGTNWIASSNAILANESFSPNLALTIYPNPVSNTLFIENSMPMDHIKIFNILGVLIQEVQANSDAISVNLSSYSNGVYFIRVYNEEGSFTTKKIIKH